MKVLISISFYSPYISGLTICAKNYAEGLVHKGHEVTILTTQHDKNLPPHEVQDSVHVHRLEYLFRFHKGFFIPSFLTKAWTFIRENDVVVINLPQFEGSLLALIARLFGKKVVVIYHCEVVLPKSFLNGVIETALFLSHFVTLFLSHKIVAYTKDYADSTWLLPFFSKKCKYILPPIRKPQVDAVLKEEMKRNISSRAVVIGVAARIAAEKGIEYLFEAIPFIQSAIKKEAVILIAGPKNPVGEHAYWKKLQPLLQKHENQIIFLGGIPPKNLGAFYSLLDVLVLPSVNKTEAFGIVQVEAMMLGIPVVVSNLPGVRIPTILTRMGERSNVADAKDIARKIAAVLLRKDSYTKEKEKVKEIFSFQEAIDRFEKILLSLF